jgi:hypothetical protein
MATPSTITPNMSWPVDDARVTGAPNGPPAGGMAAWTVPSSPSF